MPVVNSTSETSTLNKSNGGTGNFSRVSSNRQSVVKSGESIWSSGHLTSSEHVTLQIVIPSESGTPERLPGPLGIHVIPFFDPLTQR